MKRFLMILIAVHALSCHQADKDGNRNEKTSKENAGQKKQTVPEQKLNLTGCYLRVLQRDTLALRLEQHGHLVTGRLTFDNYQRDGSTGTVHGKIEDGILKLIYRFRSEGMNSVMEVYFKIVDNGLIHGFGDVGVKGDSTYYADKNSITYPDDDKLKKIACSQLNERYQ